jgi:hypothetical protein
VVLITHTPARPAHKDNAMFKQIINQTINQSINQWILQSSKHSTGMLILPTDSIKKKIIQ